ncbi:hypothetical protein BOO69_14345 [Sulfitobacter alexandrii]|uniref:Curlin associated repeat-containing protein n=1 Tax=Sulfitobacter alexandrii TaxID=1917485 RepID=A0A1J0WJG1_9RHOB|nr:hypothetical protein BOO69_14345 [Sulfitobacter alexandrii]
MNLFRFSAIALIVGVASPVISHADENVLYLLQSNPLNGPTGNTISVDQTAGTNTLVAGDAAGSAPARQVGDGNSGTVVIDGDNIAVLFSQTGAGGVNSPGSNNTGTVNATGNDLTGALSQAGIGNSATLSVLGTRALGSVSQIGNGNQADVSVEGTDIQGELIQNGNNNIADLTIDGSSSNVSYEIIGNNLTTVDAGPSVTTNAGTVIIRQTVIGSN